MSRLRWRRAYWLPRPLFSVFLAVLWLALVNSVSVANILVGLALGFLIPVVTRDFWPERARLQRFWPMVEYGLVLVWDIICSNLVVARLTLRRTRNLKPSFVTYPLDLHDDFAITILSGTISLTPGTVSAHYDPEHRTLLLHVLNMTDDEAAVVAQIKRRYERRLQEMFE